MKRLGLLLLCACFIGVSLYVEEIFASIPKTKQIDPIALLGPRFFSAPTGQLRLSIEHQWQVWNHGHA